jgi:hypothetical protein
MEDAIDAVSLITELFSWIGLGAGVVLLVVGFLRGAYFRGWTETLGVVVIDAQGDLAYRWLGEDNLLYEAPSIDDDTQVLEPGEDITVYVSPRDPSVGRIDDPKHEGRALRTTGWILLGIGALAVVLQFVLLFL